MANRWLAAGGDLGTYSVTAGTSYATSTSTGVRNTDYADHVIQISSSTTLLAARFTTSAGATDAAVAGEALWARIWYAANTGTTAAISMFELRDNTGPWLAFRTTTTSGVWGCYANTGTAASPTWTLVGSTFARSTALGALTLKLTIGSPHVVEAYSGDVLVASGTFTAAGLTTITNAQIGTVGSIISSWSELQVSVGISLIGGHVFYGKPSAAGNYSGWAGSYADIDEAGIDDSDLISSATAGQQSTFTYTDLPTLPSGAALGDIFLFTRAKNDGAAPANIYSIRRSGGVDTSSSNFSGVSTGIGEFLTRYAGMTSVTYNAAEFGVGSAT